jgi:competence protein ComEC
MPIGAQGRRRIAGMQGARGGQKSTADAGPETAERDFLRPIHRPLSTAANLIEVEAPAPATVQSAQLAPSRVPAPLSIRAAIARMPGMLAATLELEAARGTLFPLVPVCMAVGVLIYGSLAVEPPLHAALLATGLLAGLAIWLRRYDHVFAMRLVLAPLFIVVGIVVCSIQTERYHAQMIGSGVATTLSGYVTAVEARSDGRVRLTVRLTATERPVLRYAPGKIRASYRANAQNLPFVPGDHITGRARLMPHSGPVIPGGYDFAYHAYYDGIGGNGFFLGAPKRTATIVPRERLGQVADWVNRQRLALAGHIRSIAGEGPAGQVTAALVTGITSAIPDETTESLRRTGLAHVLSISGLHMALVAGTVIVLARLLMAAFPGFVARHPARKYAACAGMAIGFLYLFMAGGAVATVRSFAMLAVMLAAILLDRNALTMRNLAIAAIIVLAIMPNELTGPGFQMSFAATASLIAAYAIVSNRRSSAGAVSKRSALFRALLSVRDFVAGLSLTSLVAGSATMAFSAYHFHAIAPYGFLANLLAMPVISLIVMPLAVLSTLLMPLAIDAPFFAATAWGVDRFLAIAGHVASMSGDGVTGLLSVPTIAALTLAICIVAVSHTWLRWLALAPVVASLWLIAQHQAPLGYIDENAKSIMIRTGPDSAMISNARANVFATGIWRRALAVEQVKTPGKLEEVNILTLAGGEMTDAVVASAGNDQFRCSPSFCLALSNGSGPDRTKTLEIWHLIPGKAADRALQRELTRSLCGRNALVVIADPTLQPYCQQAQTRFLTAKDLALHGSTAIYTPTDPFGPITLIQAYDSIERPWNWQRRFSRPARGLAEYQ